MVGFFQDQACCGVLSFTINLDAQFTPKCPRGRSIQNQ